jgi:putative transposase
MIRAHRIRLNPTPEQEVYFRKACGIARFTFNFGLAAVKQAIERREPYSVYVLKKQFNARKRTEFPWVYEVGKSAAETGFRNLQKALINWRKSKSGERQGPRVNFPKFKSKKNPHQSFEVANDKFSVDGHWLKLPKLPPVNMTESLRFSGKVINAVISCEAGWWFVSITVELPDEIKPNNGECLGVDLGLKQLATCSDGTVYENQAHLRHSLRKLRRLQRTVSRRQKGSQRRAKAVKQLARAHWRIKCLRQDALHKMTTSLARRCALVGLEDLNVAGMLRNHHLALSLSDAAFGETRRQLEYKCPAHGGQAVVIPRFLPTSQVHHGCGTRNHDLTLADRLWLCPGCGDWVDRDLNAAQNILTAALALASPPAGSVATSAVNARGEGRLQAARPVPLVETSTCGVHFCTLER